jgi:hypothetical protein
LGFYIIWLCRRGSEADLADECARLRRQLSVVLEARAAEINDDNLRLIGQLTEVGPSLPSGPGCAEAPGPAVL